MRGSLQEKNGKYYAVFRVNGKQKWVNLQIPTTRGNKRKAEQALQKVLTEYTENEHNINDMLFTDYLSNWITKVKFLVKPTTYETYCITINKKIIPYFSEKRLNLSDLKPQHFTDYFIYLKQNGKSPSIGLSKKTVKNIRGVISSALESAVDDLLIQSNPVEKSKMPVFEQDTQLKPVTYTPEEVRKLLQFAKETESHVYTFLLLALSTGLRRGELLGLTWGDIDYNSKQLTVNKNRSGTSKEVTSIVMTPKTNSSNRIIPLTDNVIAELKSEQAKQAKYKKLFGNSYVANYDYVIRNKLGKPYSNLSCIDRVVDRLEKNAGLKHCTIHQLRHTVASLLDSNGVPTQDITVLLGHSDTRTTEKIYIHRNRTAKRENIALLNSLYDN